MKRFLCVLMWLVLAFPAGGESVFIITAIDNGGAVIDLQDGRAFLVRPEDRVYSQKWSVGDPVSLSSGNGEYWSVVLVNRGAEMAVKAKPIY